MEKEFSGNFSTEWNEICIAYGSRTSNAILHFSNQVLSFFNHAVDKRPLHWIRFQLEEDQLVEILRVRRVLWKWNFSAKHRQRNTVASLIHSIERRLEEAQRVKNTTEWPDVGSFIDDCIRLDLKKLRRTIAQAALFLGFVLQFHCVLLAADLSASFGGRSKVYNNWFHRLWKANISCLQVSMSEAAFMNRSNSFTDSNENDQNLLFTDEVVKLWLSRQIMVKWAILVVRQNDA